MSETPQSHNKAWFTNFIVAILLGSAALMWLATYTDWLPIVGNWLGLGGIFAWIAFVFGLITDARKQALQDSLDRFLDHWHPATTLLIVLMVFGLFLLSVTGSLVLESKSTQTHYITYKEKDKSDELRLASGGAVKKPMMVLWSANHLELKTTGLPSKQVKISPFKRTKVKVPDDFYRPLVLLWPEHLLTDKTRKLGGSLKITLERAGEREILVEQKEYRGNTIWLGCADDVPIPKQNQDMRELTLTLNKDVPENARKSTFAQWQSVKAHALNYRPQDNDRLFVEIKGPQGHFFNEQEPLTVNIRDKKATGSNFADHVLEFDLKRRKD